MRPLENLTPSSSRHLPRWTPWVVLTGLILLALGLVWFAPAHWFAPPPGELLQVFIARISTFSTIFLGIFIEAVPYLLLGSLASGVVEVFFRVEEVLRLSPKNPLLSAGLGSLMGIFFPVCECGVVPLTRRLLRKKLSPVMGLTFLLAAPVLNPIVIASTLAAFGPGTIFWGRLGLTALVALATGLSFALLKPASPAVVREDIVETHPHPVQPENRRQKWTRAALHGVDDFFEMGRFLVIGAALAALMQTFLPRQTLLAVTHGPILPVLALMGLAVLLSVCSTVDAFIALAFAGLFPPGAVLAFLVFGPMVDIKSTFMYLRAFPNWVSARLILVPLVLSLIAGVLLNLILGAGG